jgi:hypothetical protein
LTTTAEKKHESPHLQNGLPTQMGQIPPQKARMAAHSIPLSDKSGIILTNKLGVWIVLPQVCTTLITAGNFGPFA